MKETLELELMGVRNLKSKNSDYKFCVALVQVEDVVGEIFLSGHFEKGQLVTVRPVLKRDANLKIGIGFEVVN